MRAYVDASCLVLIALRQKGYDIIEQRLKTFDECITSTLTEAEVRSALQRAGSSDDGSKVLRTLGWLRPQRRLTVFISRVLLTGVPLKGADLWHLAVALHATPDLSQTTFLTLDGAQRQAALDLGFLI